MFSWWLLVFLLWPASATATAGFAERHSRLEYNRLAELHWTHPGDGCDAGSFCFRLVRKEPRQGGFPGLDCSLLKISVPRDKAEPLIIAQCCGEEGWLVYDLAREECLIRSASYEQALALCLVSGGKKPRLADASRGARGLRQTWASSVEDWAWLALLSLPALAAVGMPVSIIGIAVQLSGFRRTRRRRHLVGSLLFLIPALPGLWLGGMLFHHMVLRHAG